MYYNLNKLLSVFIYFKIVIYWKAEYSAAITPVFSDTCSFRNCFIYLIYTKEQHTKNEWCLN